ncbi:MAG: HD domain-containing protein [Minwuia sp.]|nr:HD domain-containing protein [Minwuia sp.]
MAMNDVEKLFARLQVRGTGAYGLSDVSQLEHALQCAMLAEAQGGDSTLIIAALLHDIGHLATDTDEALADQGIDDRHELAGARILDRVFGPGVADPVRLHVAAKRYLCAVEPDYFERLSDDSVRSLELQGGLFGAADQSAFVAEPGHRAAIALRRIDDMAKVQGLTTPTLAEYRAMADELAWTGDRPTLRQS